MESNILLYRIEKVIANTIEIINILKKCNYQNEHEEIKAKSLIQLNIIIITSLPELRNEQLENSFAKLTVSIDSKENTDKKIQDLSKNLNSYLVSFEGKIDTLQISPIEKQYPPLKALALLLFLFFLPVVLFFFTGYACIHEISSSILKNVITMLWFLGIGIGVIFSTYNFFYLNVEKSSIIQLLLTLLNEKNKD